MRRSSRGGTVAICDSALASVLTAPHPSRLFSSVVGERTYYQQEALFIGGARRCMIDKEIGNSACVRTRETSLRCCWST